jgi:hypothetical protein
MLHGFEDDEDDEAGELEDEDDEDDEAGELEDEDDDEVCPECGAADCPGDCDEALDDDD